MLKPAPDPYPLFSRPDRVVEATAWVRRYPAWVESWRGRQGESLLHWGALTDLGLLLALIDAGVDPNIADATGHTPLDWLNERLWMGAVDEGSPLDAQGRWRLRSQTETLVPGLWGRGGRAGASPDTVDSMRTWGRAGAWPLLDMLRADEGLEAWRGRGPQKESVLHAWVTAPQTPDKHRFLERAVRAGFPVDEPDGAGRTPLWWAVDAWLTRPAQSDIWAPAIAALRQAGADADCAPPGVEPPSRLPFRVEADEATVNALSAALGA